jgi:RsiW-degrading membrane proteinase PrsW (M82 family)
MGISHIILLLAAALLPPYMLLKLVVRMDRVEPEPQDLLMRLFWFGVLCALPVIVLEVWAEQFADIFPTDSMAYALISYFAIPGFIEEGMKFSVLKRFTWRHPAFNYKFDAIVYAVFASLGFAAIENVMYVFDYGFSTAMVRAVMAIPGHATFGVIMGAGYAQAKCLSAAGNEPAASSRCTKAWLTAAVAHGLYDFLIMGLGGGVIFYVYFIALIVAGVLIARDREKHDGPVDPFVTDGFVNDQPQERF